MIEIPEGNKKIADEYRKSLRELKRRGLLDGSVEIPPDVADSMLALHQNAQAVYWAELQNRREAERCQT